MKHPIGHHAYAENAQLPMAEVEGEGHTIRTVNAAFCRLLGRSKEDLIGKTFDQLVPQGHGCMDLLDEVLRAGEQRPSGKTHRHGSIARGVRTGKRG